ncbi:hypothetical protein [Flavihumibacter sp.]|uniref:hypothetical protein n=1 Tax=Flavihumibacter sp. TaxID=1913981 RepID=UPI002FCB6651
MLTPGKHQQWLLLIFMVTAAFCFSCNNRQSAIPELTLNNGVKWNSDDSTNSNVASLQRTLDRYPANEATTLVTYKEAATELQEGVNQLVKQCKMKGPDHDALHAWLEPFMGEVKALKASATAEESAKHFETLRKYAILYPEYFE